jgi:hypothetical protein
MDDDVKQLLEAIRQENAAAHAETRAHTDKRVAETQAHMDKRAAETQAHADRRFAETQDHLAALREHVNTTAAETQAHADRRFAETQENLTALRQHVDSTAAETRRHFDITAEQMQKRVDLLAEAITINDEKAERRASEIEVRIERGFADTQAMIRFSHADLDRRVRSLEETVGDLQSRVERLESRTN